MRFSDIRCDTGDSAALPSTEASTVWMVHRDIGNYHYSCNYQELTWDMAKDFCDRNGGKLAKTDSAELIMELRKFCGQDKHLWVGAFRIVSSILILIKLYYKSKDFCIVL